MTSKTKENLRNLFSSISLFIITAKLDAADVGALHTLAEAHGAHMARSIENASVVVTAIQARKRLERHISAELAVCDML
jgi:hypothetical protein